MNDPDPKTWGELDRPVLIRGVVLRTWDRDRDEYVEAPAASYTPPTPMSSSADEMTVDEHRRGRVSPGEE